jgi:NADPH:quinone reductase-like Zn-dependent oxidoreductase
MRAVRYHEAGGPDVLQIDTIDRPSVARDEILVSIEAASPNPTDAKRRARGVGPLPKTVGSDFAGVVEETGSKITEFSPGDRVCGTGLHTTRFQQGSFADYVSVPTDIVAPLPDGVTFREGAAVALVGVTAWRALLDHAELRPTETCLVHGGTGGVGHVAVQLADSLNATVVATAGSEETRRAAANFGADEVFSYDRDHEDLRAAVVDAVGPVDVVLDHRVDEYFTFDLDVAAFNGRIVQYSSLDGTVEHSGAALRKNLTIQAMTMSNLATRTSLRSVASVLEPVLDLVARGGIAPTIARSYALEEAAEAQRSLMSDSFIGKLLVEL